MPSGFSDADATRSPPAALLILLAIGIGGLVANLYYAQPLIASIAPELGVSSDLAGSIVSVAQIGYGTGLFLRRRSRICSRIGGWCSR